MSNLPPNQSYTQNSGSTSSQPFIIQFNSRNPTPQDVNYSIQQPWKNTLTDEYWILQSFISSVGVVTADWRKIGSGALGIETLTGNTGGAVGPDVSHNVNLLGVSPISVTGMPLNNTLEIDIDPDLLAYYSLTPYIVGPVGDVHAQFTGTTAIQDANDQAVLDGADATNPKIIWIKPSTYTQNANISPYVSLAGSSLGGDSSSARIVGTVTFSSASPSSSSISGITLESTGSNSALAIAGAFQLNLTLNNCSILANNGTGINCAAPTAVVNCYNSFFRSAAGQKTLNVTDGEVSIYVGNLRYTDTPSTISGVALSIYQSVVEDSFIFTGNAGGRFNNCNFSAPSQPVVDTSSNSTIQLLNCFTFSNSVAPYVLTGTSNISFTHGIIVSPSAPCATVAAGCMFNSAYSAMVSNDVSGYYITGTGNVLSHANTPFAAANALDPALTQVHPVLNVGNLSFDGGATPVANDGELIIGNGTTGFPSIGNITSLDGSITVTNGPGTIDLSASTASSVVQYATITDGGVPFSTATTFTYNNTIPTNANGVLFMTLSITPQNAANILVVRFNCSMSIDRSVMSGMACWLIRDADVNAVATNAVGGINGTQLTNCLNYSTVAGSTTPTTFNVYIGAQAGGGGTLFINAAAIGAGVPFAGGTMFSTLEIWEVAP